MRPLTLVAALLGTFLLGGFVEYMVGVPFGMALRMAASLNASAADSAAVPRFSTIRGLQDAPRSETPLGARTDYQRCVSTMVLRRESEAEAQQVCRKIITGIGG